MLVAYALARRDACANFLRLYVSWCLAHSSKQAFRGHLEQDPSATKRPPAKFTALVAGSKPKMQGKKPPYGSLNGYWITCTEWTTLEKLTVSSSSVVSERVALGRLPLPLQNKVFTLGFQHFS